MNITEYQLKESKNGKTLSTKNATKSTFMVVKSRKLSWIDNLEY